MVQFEAMGKKIAMTYAYSDFRSILNAEEIAELDRILLELEACGRLEEGFED